MPEERSDASPCKASPPEGTSERLPGHSWHVGWCAILRKDRATSFGIRRLSVHEVRALCTALGLQRKECAGPETQGEAQVWPTDHPVGPTPKDLPLQDILLPFSAMLGAERVSRLLWGGTGKVPFNYNLELLHEHFGLPASTNQQARRQVTVFVG